MPIRITTWNVNGIRNPFGYKPWSNNRTFSAMFDILEADIVIMQELKIQKGHLTDDMVLVDGWDCFFSVPKHKKGYSGVGIYTRKSKCAPIQAEEGLLGALCPPNSETPYRELPADESIGGYPTTAQLLELGVDVDAEALDSEGRCVAIEFPAFVLIGLYCPANSNGLRDDFRYGFICAMDLRIRNLIKMGKRVVVTGDLNVSREPIDTANALETMKKEGVTPEEYISSPNRRLFNQLLEGGAVVEPRDEGREKPVLWDICRGFHPRREGMYTHWEQKINARPGNYGSRIDFILCSLDMKPWFVESDIQAGLMGSDHCPVYAVLQDSIVVDGWASKLLNHMNPPGMFQMGERTRPFVASDTLVFSGRRFKDFDKRQSIRDMFTRKPSLATQPSIPGTEASAGEGSTDVPLAPQTLASPFSESVLDTLPTEQSSGDITSDSQAKISVTSRPASTIVQKKRNASIESVPKVAKKLKSSGSTKQGVALSNGQRSMKSFFAPQLGSNGASANDTKSAGSVATTTPHPTLTPSPTKPTPRSLPSQPDVIPRTPPRASPATSTTFKPRTPSAPPFSPTASAITVSPATSVHDPIASKESWTKLFTKKPPPRCECHDEPCKSYKTKIKGPNQGREFWICPRPVGPSGDKERDTEWRCPTFIWASDWNTAQAA